MERTTQPSPTERSPRRIFAERGATLVEYALVFALLAVASLGAVEFLQRQSENEINNQAECVSNRPPPTGDCAFAPVPSDVSFPDPGFSPPTSAPPNPDTVPSITLNPTPEQDNPPLPWQVRRSVTLTQSVTADPPLPDEPVAGVRIRGLIRVTDPLSPPNVLYTFPVECTTAADGTCTLAYNVDDPNVMHVSLTVIGVDANPAPTIPSNIADFNRVVGP
ncbi:MAG TPA: hypothetical protein VFN04_02255 [Protaetiibacter sp.]|nr:hypothetical protein [Protaetiibacter sp.]